MVTTTSQLDEIEGIIQDLEGAYEALPMLIFILKLSLHQARTQLQTAESAVPMMVEVEAEVGIL